KQWQELRGRIARYIIEHPSESNALSRTWERAGAFRVEGRKLSAAQVRARPEPLWASYIDFEKALDEGLVRFSFEQRGGYRVGRLKFLVFFCSVFIAEGLFQAFAIWLLLKFLFWVSLIYHYLPGRGLTGRRRAWELRLDMLD